MSHSAAVEEITLTVKLSFVIRFKLVKYDYRNHQCCFVIVLTVFCLLAFLKKTLKAMAIKDVDSSKKLLEELLKSEDRVQMAQHLQFFKFKVLLKSFT